MPATHIAQIHEYLCNTISDFAPDPAYTRLLLHILTETRESNQAATVLPLLACQAAGGTLHQAVPVASAWRALYLAAHIMDDVEDGDIAAWGGDTITSAELINAATGFFAVTNLILLQNHENIAPDTRHALVQAFNHVTLQMAGGQHRDLKTKTLHNIEAYLQGIGAKSGQFFALALTGGAIVARADAKKTERFGKFGYNLGIIVQLLNDIVGFYTEGHHSDLLARKRTLPLLFAEITASPEQRTRLQQLLSQAGQSKSARRQLRDLVREQGGDTCTLAEITRHQTLALSCLMPGNNAETPLRRYLEDFLQRELSRIYTPI
ncbi:MAG: hypothetical protein D6694_06290 [Gammaproteobacteria bacterium]|nr:MAG: hypothetical protein D6694_06290 [Gammaproteobacteria bacterium]